MNEEINLLNTVYQSSKMGVDSINQIVCKAQNEQIRQRLLQDKNSFDQIATGAADLIFKSGSKPEEKSIFAKFGAEMGAKISVMSDSSPSKMAEMMIEGASCGIIEVKKAQNNAPSVSTEVQNLANNLIVLQEKIFTDYRAFL